MRSFLTSLGIIFGVGSVIAMLAISEGAQRKALLQIEAMGIDKIIVYTKEPKDTGSSSDQSSQSFVKSFGLTEVNLQHIKRMKNIQNIEFLKDTRQKIYKGDRLVDIKVIGVSQGTHESIKSKFIKGRSLSKIDGQNGSMVCVIGKDVVRKLFPFGDLQIIGRKITLKLGVFTVVGIYDSKGMSTLPELGRLNECILIPFAVSKRLYNSSSMETSARSFKIINIDYDTFIILIKELSSIEHTAKRIKNYLRKTHGDTLDWATIVPLKLFEQKKKTQGIFTIIMASIASISLVVGGVGIMNIMLANIYERRKEIGTRRALGAKQKDILRQFLFETVFLTISGGILGVILGVVLSESVTYYANWPTVYTTSSVVISLVVSSLVGVVFGTYPAIKAAKQNPIDVLRAD